ncbi:MAG: chemotaxis protein CheW [Bacteroidales bacterium]|nr:chemotaxis protein CheW [Bacteroidales bacterium]MBN2757001.1 chemotaxis protein CheW [Bacteroidales bacterium]
MANYVDLSGEIKSYLTFKLGDEVFACHVNKLLHILEIPEITEVPGSPLYMNGIIDLRGSVLPIIDARVKLGMPPIEFTKDTCIIVMDITLDDDNLLVGVLVEAVLEVLEFEDDKILPPPNLGKKYKSEYIEGIVKKDDHFIMLLDIDTVFSLDEIDYIKETAIIEEIAELEVEGKEEKPKEKK